MVFSKLAAFVAAVALSSAPAVIASSHMILSSGVIAYTREDPIVNPGAISTHVHSITGPDTFSASSDYDSLRTSKCTTAPFQGVDYSAYWTSAIYYQDQNTKKFSVITGGRNIYYFFDRNGPGETVHAFPKGLRMIAGTPGRTTYNASNFEDQAVSFVCLDYSGAVSNDPAYAERKDIHFPDPNKCKDGIRAQVFFPQCWDGVNLDSPNHKDHMAYPIDNYNGGSCPKSHPVHTVGIFYETFIDIANHPYWGPGAIIPATGDASFLGWHGDFQNGWDVDMLQNAVNNCHNMNGDIHACPVLAPYINTDAANACTLADGVKIVDEPVGLNGQTVDELPGCNPIRADGVALASTCSKAVPGFRSGRDSLPSGWGISSCVAEANGARALSGASTKLANMTMATCSGYCQSQGFSIAGAEFGDECYCGNSFSNGATGADVGFAACNTRCAGNGIYENCGGPQRLTIAKKGAVSAPPPVSSPVTTPTPTPTPTSIKTATPTSIKTTPTSVQVPPTTIVAVPTSIKTSATSSAVSTPSSVPAPNAPAGWTSAGCVTDGSARALTGFSTSAADMTVEKCTSLCASKSFSIAGVEYGTECYCGNSLVNGLGAASTQCTSTCGGSKSEICGGSWTLSLFKSSGAPSAPSQPAPVTWKKTGCVSDGSARALTGYYLSSQSMTVEICTSACASKGFTKAGLEFGTECFCGNSYSNGLGQPLDDGRACYMTAAGNNQEKAGGTWALSIYEAQTSNGTAKRSKHFGRVNHYRNTQF
jgi:hypothetical protein